MPLTRSTATTQAANNLLTLASEEGSSKKRGKAEDAGEPEGKTSTPSKRTKWAKYKVASRSAARDDLSVVTPFKPRTIAEVKDVVFEVGKTTYTSRNRAEADIKATTERDKKAITFASSANGKGTKDVDTLDARCVVAGCPFRLTFRHVPDIGFRCTCSEAHTCTEKPDYKARKTFHTYKSRELASVLDAPLREQPRMMPKAAKAILQPYVNKDVSTDFAGKCLEHCRERRNTACSASQDLGKLAAWASMVTDSNIGVMEVQTTNAEGMK